mmetsp:Transcript_23278/g.53751  ORF Transcript_23278/g.53751 Transcript_23278/m.53751 type:complete len:250 (+) Transcript_23278:1230-1979(+)
MPNGSSPLKVSMSMVDASSSKSSNRSTAVAGSLTSHRKRSFHIGFNDLFTTLLVRLSFSTVSTANGSLSPLESASIKSSARIRLTMVIPLHGIAGVNFTVAASSCALRLAINFSWSNICFFKSAIPSALVDLFDVSALRPSPSRLLIDCSFSKGLGVILSRVSTSSGSGSPKGMTMRAGHTMQFLIAFWTSLRMIESIDGKPDRFTLCKISTPKSIMGLFTKAMLISVRHPGNECLSFRPKRSTHVNSI